MRNRPIILKMSDNKKIGNVGDPADESARLKALEALLRRVRKAAADAATACGQYAIRADDEPYTGPALPGQGPFQIVMRNDPEAGTFVRRLQGRPLELKTAAAIIVAELAQGSDEAAAAICREIDAAVAATHQRQRDERRRTFTGQLEEDFPNG